MKDSIAWMLKICFLAIIILGTLGNILCIIICRRKRVKQHSFSICLIVLAVSDTVSLHSNLWTWWIDLISEHLIVRSSLSCKFELFFLWLSADLSSWILCLITIQRFISVWLPTKAKSLCNIKCSIIGCVVLIVLASAKNLHYVAFEYTIRRRSLKNTTVFARCEPESGAYEHFLFNEWAILDLVLGAMLPFLIIAICNGMIVGRLYRTDRQRCDDSRERKMNNINVMLTLNSMAFLILVVPIFIIGTIIGYGNLNPNTMESVKDVYHITLLLWMVNPAINFYIYCLGGPLFRRELKEFFHRGNRVGQTDTNM